MLRGPGPHLSRSESFCEALIFSPMQKQPHRLSIPHPPHSGVPAQYVDILGLQEMIFQFKRS